eukprot:6874213-Pyramimonas_sp.AAC.1
MEDNKEHIVARLQAHPCKQVDAKLQPLRYKHKFERSGRTTVSFLPARVCLQPGHDVLFVVLH